MNPDLAFSPAPLSYVAALRGIKSRQPGERFTYGEVMFSNPDRIVCLAASNPEGNFYGLALREEDKMEGEAEAKARQVGNVTFLTGKLSEFLAKTENKTGAIPPLNYFCCDERQANLMAPEHTALFSLAEKLLLPGGLFGYRYRAYEKEDGALCFLVRELAPEMNAEQAMGFLQELKNLGVFYFRNHLEASEKLDQAITSGVPDKFFADYEGTYARSGSFDTIVALRPRGFVYAGDADIRLNYIDLAAPANAHQIVVDCRNNHLYESVKDFTLNRQERCDIWVHCPVTQTANLPELFGNFVYGITIPKEDVPKQVKTEGKQIDLSAPLFIKLIDLMTLMPVGIGDFLAHPNGKNFSAADVVNAIQTLVACGIARPMRGHYKSTTRADIAQPRLVGSFNRYLDKTAIDGNKIWLASPVAGSAMEVSARDALVMQALNRAGLANAASVLLPELQRLAKDPVSAASILHAVAPTSETATQMIKDSVMESAVQWYAYGLLAAA